MEVGARIPQIRTSSAVVTGLLVELSLTRARTVKNFKTRCAGLSLALFLFSIAGNTTYALSILAASLEFKHIAANAGWLAGENLHILSATVTLRAPARSRKRSYRVSGHLR